MRELNLIPIRNELKVRKEDIFIVSYPRSGNTWMRFLLGSIIKRKEIDWMNLDEVVPDIYRVSEKKLNRLDNPRILKSHEPYDPRYKKIIYLIRDPRDVVISLFFFVKKFQPETSVDLNIDKFILMFLRRTVGNFGSWKDHVNSYFFNPNLGKNIIIVRYEDLLENTFLNIKKVTDFLNYHITDEIIYEAIKRNNFSIMKQKEEKQEQENKLFKNSDKKIKFIRKGKKEEWKEYLNNNQISLIETSLKKEMELFGYRTHL